MKSSRLAQHTITKHWEWSRMINGLLREKGYTRKMRNWLKFRKEKMSEAIRVKKIIRWLKLKKNWLPTKLPSVNKQDIQHMIEEQ